MSRLHAKHVIIFLISFFLFITSLKLGAIHTTWAELFSWLTGTPTNDTETLFSKVRLPRTLAAFYVGSALATGGAILQSILRNPLADSYTLGISGGSAVGASLVLVFSLAPQMLWIPIFSNIGALLVLLLVLSLSLRTMQSGSRTLILIGLMISLFFGALSVFLVSLLPADKNQSALAWLLGEFGSPRDSWAYLFLFISTPLTLFLIFKSKALDALALGEVKAMTFGYKPKKEKIIFVSISTVLTSLAITLSGLVGFIGLVSPHIARKWLKTSKHFHILISSHMIGGCLLLCADTLGRILIEDREIPAGSLSALIGAPVLIYLLLGKSHAQTE